MGVQVNRCRTGVFYFQSSRVGTRKKVVRLLLMCSCCFLLILFVNPRLLKYFGLQPGKSAPDDATSHNHRLSPSKNSVESRSNNDLPTAENSISFLLVDEESEESRLMVSNREESDAESLEGRTPSLEYVNQTYNGVSFKIDINKLDELLKEVNEAGINENLLSKFLPSMSLNELKKIQSSPVRITVKATTWLQLIRIGMVQRNPEYLKKHVKVIPDAVEPGREQPDGTSMSLKKILYWNKFYESPDYDFGVGREPFISAGCPVSSCYVTSNRTRFRLEDVDAIVWHGRDDDLSLPPKRYPHTRYVFFMAESPEHVYLDFERYRNVFNYTMTFRTDSDVYNPLHNEPSCVKRKTQIGKTWEFENYGFFTPLPYPALELLERNFALGKTRMAAWFVSHCTTASRREKLVENLQKYITVDVFGKCGTKSCPKQKDHNPDECFRLVEKKYKFYFAFENSLCDNYITEKFFGAARFDIVPVVYGLGAYEELAPPHSFINALDFPSIRHLADYLKYLDTNDTAYNEYFEWKVTHKAVMRYKAMVTPEYNQISWCQLCEKLHSDTSITIYEDLNHWRQHYNCIDNDLPLFSKLINGADISNIQL